MAWHEHQAIVTEGFDTKQMLDVLQVWLPINYRTMTVHPTAQQKFFVSLTHSQRTLLGSQSEASVVAEYTLTAADKDVLIRILNVNPGFVLGFFSAILGPTLKFALPAGWVSSVISQTVKTLIGYILNVERTTKDAAYVSANISVGGKLRELWQTVTPAAGETYFYRTIQYEVLSGAEHRQFVLLSTRYALIQ